MFVQFRFSNDYPILLNVYEIESVMPGRGSGAKIRTRSGTVYEIIDSLPDVIERLT